MINRAWSQPLMKKGRTMNRLRLPFVCVAVSIMAACTVEVFPPNARVAVVSVTLGQNTLQIGETTTATALLQNTAGDTLSNRLITWSSSNLAVARVSDSGTVTAVAAGGPVTITATSEGHSGTASVTVTSDTVNDNGSIRALLERCPTNDPAITQIRQDFELRQEGQLISSAIACTEPYTTITIVQLTDELIALQVLRAAYHMNAVTQGKLPWTTQSLYGWMASSIRGVNFKNMQGQAQGQLSCCDVINGQLYLSSPRQNASQRNSTRDWLGISLRLDLYAHEVRHAGQGGPAHVDGCPAAPLPSDPLGCDATYNLANLGSFGVQYWLHSSWATGFLNIGIGCLSPALAMEYATFHASTANSLRSRFVSNAPPVVTASAPFGGPCP
jgi:Big-like domain-containing protein